MIKTLCLSVAIVATTGIVAYGDDTANGESNWNWEKSDPTQLKSVLVSVFNALINQNPAARGLEDELARAVIREIDLRTPYTTGNGNLPTDSQLSVKVVRYKKAILKRSQLNEVREAEITIAVEMVWRDLRTGKILSQANPGKVVQPVQIQCSVAFAPELRQSQSTAHEKAFKLLARKIVNAMEKPW